MRRCRAQQRFHAHANAKTDMQRHAHAHECDKSTAPKINTHTHTQPQLQMQIKPNEITLNEEYFPHSTGIATEKKEWRQHERTMEIVHKISTWFYGSILR